MYSVLDLCEIFDINPNSFPSLARRLELNKESQILKNDYQAKKRYYNQKAFEMLVNYFKKKNKSNYNKDSILLDYIEKIKTLEENCSFYNINEMKNKIEYLEKNIKLKNNKIEILTNENEKLKSSIKELENIKIKLEKIIEDNKNKIEELEKQSLFDFYKNKKRRKEKNE